MPITRVRQPMVGYFGFRASRFIVLEVKGGVARNDVIGEQSSWRLPGRQSLKQVVVWIAGVVVNPFFYAEDTWMGKIGVSPMSQACVGCQQDVADYHAAPLGEVSDPVVDGGEWGLCPCTGVHGVQIMYQAPPLPG